jgi:hypothetical protein
MKRPKRHRPLLRARVDPPPGADLGQLARAAVYVPSADHKDHWIAGLPPNLRSDATRCPREISQEQAQAWLRDAIANGDVGAPWDEQPYPRMVWKRVDDTVYEARLSNAEQGWYHGYPIDRTEWPTWLQ